MQGIALIDRALGHGDRLALQGDEDSASYADLLRESEHLALALLAGRRDLEEARIAFLLPAGIDYVAVQWAIWRAGGIAVPLNPEASLPEIEHVLTTAGATRVIAGAGVGPGLRDVCGSHAVERLALEDIRSLRDDGKRETTNGRRLPLPTVAAERRAMILFTSGTTSKPKGVVSTHANLRAQIETLVEAWGWQPGDSIPLFLPLHHVHGIVNVLACALWSGARVEPFPSFDIDGILARVASGAYTVFMAVPTIYVKLIQRLESLSHPVGDASSVNFAGAGTGAASGFSRTDVGFSRSEVDREACCRGFARMRLMVSGSAALPASVHKRWQELTGQVLLERYGMTEIGMALSNPLVGERRPGAVGRPLPGVSVRLVSESGEIVDRENVAGEIHVRGPAVFQEYWNDAVATRDAFTDGWFRTGDVAVVENGYYRILGRRSVDIIKSGGYKLSALEIESVLLDHPDIRECAVVGVDEDTWGEVVAAAVVVRDGAQLDLEGVRRWAAGRMSRYKLPKQLKVVTSLPRNAMGKVTKPAVKTLFEPAPDPLHDISG